MGNEAPRDTPEVFTQCRTFDVCAIGCSHHRPISPSPGVKSCPLPIHSLNSLADHHAATFRGAIHPSLSALTADFPNQKSNEPRHPNMKIISRIFVCAVLLTVQQLHAQQSPSKADATAPVAKAKTKAGAAPTKQVSKDAAGKPDADAAAAKAAGAQERKKVHTIAVMSIRSGRTNEEVMFEVFPDQAPLTVKNFRQNVEKGTYNGLAFHRAVKDYLVQTGDPASRDDNARDKWGLTQESTIPGEFKLPHTTGAVAMARRGDKSNPERHSDCNQFYFVLGDMSGLDGQYTVFGQVVSGLDVLKKISRSVTDSNDCPVVRVEIKKMQVTEQQGPVAALTKTTGSGKLKHTTKPDVLKGPMEKFLERIW